MANKIKVKVPISDDEAKRYRDIIWVSKNLQRLEGDLSLRHRYGVEGKSRSTRGRSSATKLMHSSMQSCFMTQTTN